MLLLMLLFLLMLDPLQSTWSLVGELVRRAVRYWPVHKIELGDMQTRTYIHAVKCATGMMDEWNKPSGGWLGGRVLRCTGPGKGSPRGCQVGCCGWECWTAC